MTEKNTDMTIRRRINAAAETYSPSSACKAETMERINNMRNNGTSEKYSRKRTGRIVLAVAICAALFSTTALAVGQFTSITKQSSGSYDYNTYSQMVKAEKSAGITIEMPDSLPGGYAFEGAAITNSEKNDASGNSLGTFRGISATYSNGTGSIAIDADKDTSDDLSTFALESEQTADGTVLYYTRTTTVTLPEGEQPTAEESARAASDPDHFFISYGGRDWERETTVSDSTAFEKDGQTIEISCADGSADKDQLFQIAEKIAG